MIIWAMRKKTVIHIPKLRVGSYVSFHCCYGNYLITNHETCGRGSVSLPCHIIFKDLSKVIICY